MYPIRIARSLRCWLLLTGLAALSCAGPSDPDEVILVAIGDDSLSIVDLNSYLRSNLLEEEHDSREKGELDRVKSRLFDAFVDEHLLVGEARRMGIEVSEEEVDAYLPAEPQPRKPGRPLGTPSRRVSARRRLLLQKLEEALARGVHTPTENEILAWLADRPERLTPERRLTIRSRRFDVIDEAEQTARRIRNGLEEFEAATAAGEVTAAVELEEGDLSPEVRIAIGGLEPGEISEPVAAQGGVFLFRLEGRADGELGEETRILRGRAQLMRERGRLATEAMIRELRAGSGVQIYDHRLPFAYLPPRDAS